MHSLGSTMRLRSIVRFVCIFALVTAVVGCVALVAPVTVMLMPPTDAGSGEVVPSSGQ